MEIYNYITAVFLFLNFNCKTNLK